jgi:hypothetical protein
MLNALIGKYDVTYSQYSKHGALADCSLVTGPFVQMPCDLSNRIGLSPMPGDNKPPA